MRLLGRIKLNCRSYMIKAKLLLKKNVVVKGKITIAKYSSIFVVGNAKLKIGSLFMNSYSSITARYNVSIGDNVMFGENVHVYDHNHRFSRQGIPFSCQGYKNKPVVIGNNCWIGTGTTILAGAHIGNNCVIGAGCVINTFIPDNSVVKPNMNYSIEKINYNNGGNV